ncbi:MAG: hypothetical protein ACXABD_18680, partial [Candidatus Thorarchaeota archaeon]|jgi:hypothetical protein
MKNFASLSPASLRAAVERYMKGMNRMDTHYGLEYWNGHAWRKINHEYLGEDVDNLVKMAMARTDKCGCRILGHNICTCASASYKNETSFSRPFGSSVYSLHGPPNRNIAHSGHHINYSHPGVWGQTTPIPIEDIVDKWLLLPGDIEIEASL